MVCCGVFSFLCCATIALSPCVRRRHLAEPRSANSTPKHLPARLQKLFRQHFIHYSEQQPSRIGILSQESQQRAAETYVGLAVRDQLHPPFAATKQTPGMRSKVSSGGRLCRPPVKQMMWVGWPLTPGSKLHGEQRIRSGAQVLAGHCVGAVGLGPGPVAQILDGSG